MRARAMLLAALALLGSACGVVVEDAPCRSRENCPAGQGCGANGRCSERALACAKCGVHQQCGSEAPAVECACDPAPPECGSGTGTFCSDSKTVTTCPVDAQGCTYLAAAPRTCGEHQGCVTAGEIASCACTPEPRCPGVGRYCSSAGTVTCERDNEGCLFAAAVTTCAAPEVCDGAAANAACACPRDGDSAGQGCSAQAVGVAACDASGDVVACRAVGACRVWEVATACSSTGMRCGRTNGTSECECPPNGGTDFYADPVKGTAKGSPPYPTGAANPEACRYRKLKDAVTSAVAASTPAAPARAIAAGWSGAEVLFTKEVLPIEIPAGVTLTTTDAAPTMSHYTIAVDAPNTPAVNLHEGAHLSGFKVRTAFTTGTTPAGVAVDCAGNDPVTIQALRIEAAVAGMKSPANAMTVGAGCALTVTDGWFEGATADGVLVTGPGTHAVFHSATFTANGKSGLAVAGGAKATVDGASALTANKEHGLALRAGEVTVTGTSDSPVDIGRNAVDGILGGVDGKACKLAVTAAYIHDNGNAAATPPTGNGIEIVNNDATGAGQQVSIVSSTLTSNAAAGLKVSRSSPADGTPSLKVDSVRVTGGVNGILVQPAPSGSTIHASLAGLTVTGARDGGVVFNQASGSVVSLEGSSITGNCAATTRTLSKQLGGGVVFVGGLPSVTAFSNNHIHGNQFHQLLVASGVSGAAPLLLGGAACTTANQLVCSLNPAPATGSPPTIGYAVYSTGAGVNAQFNAWTADPPDSSRDFSGNVDAGTEDFKYCPPIASACAVPPTSCP
jgi:hypothetical protein